MNKLITILLFSLFACGPTREEMERKQKHKEDSIANIDHIEQDNIANDLIKNEPLQDFVNKGTRKWKSSETGLPAGTIISTNHEGLVGGGTVDATNNYVEIKKIDGYNTVVRDVDRDLYCTLQVGDIIE